MNQKSHKQSLIRISNTIASCLDDLYEANAFYGHKRKNSNDRAILLCRKDVFNIARDVAKALHAPWGAYLKQHGLKEVFAPELLYGWESSKDFS